ncbi:MAG: TatD family hydrolase [Woeseiaceae bacterium]
MQLVDIGANLTHDTFDRDRDDVIRRAQDVGVNRMILTGASAKGSQDAVALAESRPGLMFATAGIHPHHAAEYSTDVHRLLGDLAKHQVVVAVGECGLDYFRDFSPRDAQRYAFERQLDLAAESKKPLFLHQRDAHEDFVAILEPRLGALSHAVAHCFTGDEAQLRKYIDMGLYIGITGWICDERRGMHLKEIVHLIPDNRLMLETDAPYLLPRTLSPKPSNRRNEPAFLPEVLRVVAEARGQSMDEVAAITTATANRFFDLPDR